jgi:hypothetical protein
VARRRGRRAGGIELHEEFVIEARRRIKADEAHEEPGTLSAAR